MAWATMRKLSNVNESEMTARQPSVPKCMGIKFSFDEFQNAQAFATLPDTRARCSVGEHPMGCEARRASRVLAKAANPQLELRFVIPIGSSTLPRARH